MNFVEGPMCFGGWSDCCCEPEFTYSTTENKSGDIAKFTMDRVFGMDCKQEDMFEEIGETAVQTLMQGFNSTILAYGQTGSGKTLPMG